MNSYSVIIAAHHRAHLLERAVRSVRNQAVPGLQIIIVSDADAPAVRQLARTLLTGDDLYIERFGEPGPALSRNLVSPRRNPALFCFWMMMTPCLKTI